MEQTKVVVPYRDGKVLKGFIQNFFPNKNYFHLFPVDQPSGKAIDISMKDLKAVFIVRDFNGVPEYSERKRYLEDERPSGRKVEVTFQDGEVLVGSTLGYNKNQACFCLLPADPKSNNIRVFVVLSAVKNIRCVDSPQEFFSDRLHSTAQV